MSLGKTSGIFAATIAAALLWPSSAKAQVTEQGNGPVTATGKGVVGGVLLGAEVVMMPEAIAGVDKWWAYLIGGVLGGAGGGVGGYFVETKVTAAEPSLYMLAGGMALVIPTVVLMLNATAYKPEAEEGETESEQAAPPAPEGPPAAPGAAPGPQAKAKRHKRAPRYLPPALIGFDFSGRRLGIVPGVPAVDVRPLGAQDIAQRGALQGAQVTFPMVTGRF